MRWLQDRLENLPPDSEAEETEALRYIAEAWGEAVRWHRSTNLANAALFAAFSELVEAYGESAVISMAEGLKARVERGEFTLNRRLQ